MSSGQENIDNGEGSSASAAANPPPAPTPPSGEAHLKSHKNLPRLIMAILEYDEELDRISQRLRNLPIQRELAFNEFKDPNSEDPVRFKPEDNSHIGTVKPHYNVTAMLVFCTGRQLKGKEVCCGVKKCMRGIFPLCIVPAEVDYDRMTSSESIVTVVPWPMSRYPLTHLFCLYTAKACANCQYDGMGSKCPLQKAAKKVKKENDGEEPECDEGEDLEDLEDEEDQEYKQEEDDSDDSDYKP